MEQLHSAIVPALPNRGNISRIASSWTAEWEFGLRPTKLARRASLLM
jgi:hypothetical protein